MKGRFPHLGGGWVLPDSSVKWSTLISPGRTNVTTPTRSPAMLQEQLQILQLPLQQMRYFTYWGLSSASVLARKETEVGHHPSRSRAILVQATSNCCFIWALSDKGGHIPGCALLRDGGSGKSHVRVPCTTHPITSSIRGSESQYTPLKTHQGEQCPPQAEWGQELQYSVVH